MPEQGENSLFVQEVGECFSSQGRLAKRQPGFRSRPSQIQYAQTVAQALENSETVVLEAGTGTGKTFGYLVPVLLSGRKAIVSTAGKTLQEQLFKKDIPALEASLGIRVTVKLLKGRANYICLRRLKTVRETGLPTAAAFEDLKKIEIFAATDPTGDRAGVTGVAEDSVVWPFVTSSRESCSGQKCPFAEKCFINKARQEAKEAEVVVVNHHLFLSAMAIKDESDADMLPKSDVIVLDEAHKLPEIGADFFGEEFSTRAVLELLKDIRRITLSRHKQALADKTSWEELYDSAKNPLQDFVIKLDQLGVLEGEAFNIANVKEIESSVPLLEDAYAAAVQLADSIEAVSADDEDLTALHENLVFCTGLMKEWCEVLKAPKDLVTDKDGNPGVRWVSHSMRDIRLRRTPLSFAQDFSRLMHSRPNTAWVFTSATLATGKGNFSHFLGELGLGSVLAKSWSSPFDFPNQAILYVPDGIPAPVGPEKAPFIERLVEECWPVIDLMKGKTLFLCTSRRAMQIAADALRDRIEANRRDYVVYVQNEDSRRNLLQQFRENANSILVATMGFWEGIDIKGEALSLVVIDKLPFAPKDDPVLEARCRWIRSEGGNPFVSHQIPLAAIALKQGAGRLIRSETDRGVLIVGDARIIPGSGSRYGSLFLSSLPDFSRTRKLSRVLDFWLHPNDWI